MLFSGGFGGRQPYQQDSLSRQTVGILALSLLYSIKHIGIAKCFLETITKEHWGQVKRRIAFVCCARQTIEL